MKKYTTITIKTNKILRDQAQSVAQELGVPLTTIINAYLKDFVREKSFSVSADPQVRPEVIKRWKKASATYGKDKKLRTFNDVEGFIKHLRLE